VQKPVGCFPPAGFRITHHGRTWHDDERISQYNVTDGAILMCWPNWPPRDRRRPRERSSLTHDSEFESILSRQGSARSACDCKWTPATAPGIFFDAGPSVQRVQAPCTSASTTPSGQTLDRVRKAACRRELAEDGIKDDGNFVTSPPLQYVRQQSKGGN
jgi:hypothetical protein